MSPPSACAAEQCAEVLRGIVPKGGNVRQEAGPVRIPTRDSDPTRGVRCPRTPLCIPGETSRPEDVAMVVAVTRWGDLDLDLDLALASTYGAGGIPVYWIMNIKGRQLEFDAHRAPGRSEGASPAPRSWERRSRSSS